MKKQFKARQGGFTIIEVIIVLAIASLILLIVFLAVPALQRNSRNTATRNDVANLLSGISDYESNNGGALPTAVVGAGTACGQAAGLYTLTANLVDFCGAAGTVASESQVRGSTTVNFDSRAAYVGDASAWPASAGTVSIYPGRKCAGNAATSGSGRSAAATFIIENTSGGTGKQCVDT
jgi:prepilin-type N-terminal cleavage/methylation domain-containing protein